MMTAPVEVTIEAFSMHHREFADRYRQFLQQHANEELTIAISTEMIHTRAQNGDTLDPSRWCQPLTQWVFTLAPGVLNAAVSDRLAEPLATPLVVSVEYAPRGRGAIVARTRLELLEALDHV